MSGVNAHAIIGPPGSLTSAGGLENSQARWMRNTLAGSLSPIGHPLLCQVVVKPVSIAERMSGWL